MISHIYLHLWLIEFSHITLLHSNILILFIKRNELEDGSDLSAFRGVNDKNIPRVISDLRCFEKGRQIEKKEAKRQLYLTPNEV